MEAPDARDLLEHSTAAGVVLVGGAAWQFSCWVRVPSATFHGYDVVAVRPILKGEVIIHEAPLLEALTPDENQQRGWASEVLRAYCEAPPHVRARVLATSASGSEDWEKAGEAGNKMHADAASEVAYCAEQPWRRAAAPLVDDETLQRVCLIWNLNCYAYGAKRAALFELGCMLNHSCDSNVCYTSTSEAESGRSHGARSHGTWVASRDCAAGESLCSNYIGEHATYMSTPARRDMLLSSKLFTCECSLCRAADDPRRLVPCPGCHSRNGVECELPIGVARGKGRVNYATPSSAEPGAHWLCPRCPGRMWSIERVIPGPKSMGVTGRAWERMLETNVMQFEQHAEGALAAGAGRAIEEDAAGMLDVVARSVGCKHWTAARLAAIVEGAREQMKMM
jgi:hypothetical protein